MSASALRQTAACLRSLPVSTILASENAAGYTPNINSEVLPETHFVPTFAYEFNDENAQENFFPPVSFPYGAAHASEIQYVMDLPTVALRYRARSR